MNERLYWRDVVILIRVDWRRKVRHLQDWVYNALLWHLSHHRRCWAHIARLLLLLPGLVIVTKAAQAVRAAGARHMLVMTLLRLLLLLHQQRGFLLTAARRRIWLIVIVVPSPLFPQFVSKERDTPSGFFTDLVENL